MATKILLRRDTASNWTSADPTLGTGEFGFETDSGRAKIGDGTTPWTSLAYFSPDLDSNFNTLTEETANDNEDMILCWDNTASAYRKMSRANFLKNDSIEIIADIATAKALAGTDNKLIYVTAVETVYRYELTGAGYTADDKYVLITGDAGDTRWIATAGQYSVSDIDLLATHVIKIDGTQVIGSQQVAITDVSALTSPTAGTGSGADATTFSGSECDALRAEVAELRTQLNATLAMLRTHGLIAS